MEIIAIIFGAITIWVVVPSIYFGRRRHRLDGKERDRLKFLEAENSKNEERIRNLETIVCDVDMELNAKLNRLASHTQQLRIPSEAQTIEEAGHSATMAATNETPQLPSRRTPASLSVGARLGDRFVVTRRIGAGGMGEVFEAMDETLGEPVALKVMAGMSLLDPDALARFKREAAAARRITHPNVVRLHDIGEDQDVVFISMELVDGDSLGARINNGSPMPVEELAPIARQVCAALQAAHDAGVVHRDLKPDNILLDRTGQARVIDFGVAKMPYLEGMTATGVIVGTPEYMAPEQITGKAVDARTDLYSFGAVVFHALAGRPPFSGASAIAVGFAHCNEALPSLAALRPDVPAPWIAWVEKALAKDPATRHGSAAEMAAAIPR